MFFHHVVPAQLPQTLLNSARVWYLVYPFPLQIEPLNIAACDSDVVGNSCETHAQQQWRLWGLSF